MNGRHKVRTCARVGRIVGRWVVPGRSVALGRTVVLGRSVALGRTVLRFLRRNFHLGLSGSARHRGHRRPKWIHARWRGGAFAVASLAVATIPVIGIGQESGAAPPNIVFIITDDMSWAHMGAYGSDEVDTPNLDRLAREGAVFENAFVSTPSCTPSRASILTGRNGFELEEGATLWGYLPAKFPTYTGLLADQGYRVGANGQGLGARISHRQGREPCGPAV